MAQGKRFQITGVVQGVGFRPYVHRLATDCGLGGYVANGPGGVTIEISGDAAAIGEFSARLASEAPPLAGIEAIVETIWDEAAGEDRAPLSAPRPPPFEIRASALEQAWPTSFSLGVDVAPCTDCRADYLTPGNRRYRYPFTNCTNCGPRYTIAASLPYDRARTTMAAFGMCAACRREYDDPRDRRFHAQPNACADCGPRLRLDGLEGEAALSDAVRRLRAGQILALKNVGGYQLACDARNSAAVERLRQRKRRPHKPFALLVADFAAADGLTWAEEGRAALVCGARPIVLLRRREGALVAEAVAPGQSRLGLMLPSSPFHDLLFAAPSGLGPLVMTSGNRSGEPIAQSQPEARRALAGIADAFVDHDRDIWMRADDSVVSVEPPQVLRRARGLAPHAVELGRRSDSGCVLAAGGELKGAFCLSAGAKAWLSPHIGDMDTPEGFGFYEQTLRHFLRLHAVTPEALAIDLHPGYRVTRLARRLAAELGIGREIAVQHHHAHIAACMAEHGLEGPVIGVAWDGTGFGPDGTVWGGEFLVCDAQRFERAAHLRAIPLAGGDRMVREPWRAALGYLADAFGEGAGALAAGLWPQISPAHLTHAGRALAQGVRSSSAGRLFDAVAALCGLGHAVSFEAQAAMALESVAETRHPASGYSFRLGAGTPIEVDLRPMLSELLGDLKRGTDIGAVAGAFHLTMAEVIAAVCAKLRLNSSIERVCLSGGSFQNRKLLLLARDALRNLGFTVWTPQAVPPNDGGLALGQVAVARAHLAVERAGAPAPNKRPAAEPTNLRAASIASPGELACALPFPEKF